MEFLGRDWSYSSLLLGGLTATVLVALVVAASTSGAAFGTYNPAWDGASDIRRVADDVGSEHEIALNTSDYGRVASNGTIAFVLSPASDYGPRERERVRTFVRTGGTLLVAEDYGPNGNRLLAATNSSARVDGAPVRDERYNYRSPALPLARNVSSHQFTAGVSQLTLNHGTVVRPNDATVLVRTSEFAYLDTDDDGELDRSESLRRRPVVTIERVGDGRVIVVSDPSVFINAMVDRPGNRQFVRNLLAEHERVLLDYSHAGRQPPLTVAVLRLRESLPLQFLVGLLGVGAITVWTRRPTLTDVVRTSERERPSGRREDSVDTELLFDYLRRQHPDWDESRLRRVMQGVFTHHQEESNDE